MRCYPAIVLVLILAITCEVSFAGVLFQDDPQQCPLRCECGVYETDTLVKCTEVQPDDYKALVADLAGYMEGLVTTLDVSRSSIPTLSDNFVVGKRNYSLLRTLKLNECDIEKIELRAFKGASSLEELDLSNNNLQGPIFADLFDQHCPNLNMISLKNNPMLNLPSKKPFLKSESVQELDLSGCGVTKVYQQSFSKLPSLTFVNLENNAIEFIHPDAFADLEYLEEINLSFNLIINMPPNLPSSMQILSLRGNPELNVSSLTDLSKAVTINELDISQCNIDRLPRDVFYNLRDLITLNISHNHLTNIYSPFVLRQLRYLDLSSNALSGPLDKNLLTHSSNLETLKLAWNDGLQLPEFGFLGDLTSLYLLDLSGCGMSEIRTASIDSLAALTSLNLSRNALVTLPPHIFRSTPGLTTLDLSRNQFTKIPHSLLEDNSNLRHFYMGHNDKLGGVLRKDLLANAVHLRTLDISFCNFSDVPESLPASVHRLDISGNKIEHPGHLLKLIKSLSFLEFLNIGENPWKCTHSFNILGNALKSKSIVNTGGDEGIFGPYFDELCVDQKLHKSSFFGGGSNVMRTHFWAILTFLVTMTMCVVIAVACTVAYRLCKNRLRGMGKQYHTLSESPATSPAPNRIYMETTVPILSTDPKKEQELQPVTFSKSFIFPRFPVTESDVPMSYVEGNYHHAELVP